MKNWKTKDGHEVFQVLSGRSNSYLVTTENKNILVDTGTKKNYQNLKRGITSSISKEERIDILILTHSHFDHCQNASRILKENDCQIILGKEENKFVKDGYTPVPRGTSLIPSIISRFGNLLGWRRFGYDPFYPDILVTKDYTIKENEPNIRIIGTPGHSPGSISVIVDEQIAIVGDSMFGIYKNSIYPPFSDDPGKMVDSWKKLMETKCEIFLPGHGEEIRRERLKREFEKRS